METPLASLSAASALPGQAAAVRIHPGAALFGPCVHRLHRLSPAEWADFSLLPTNSPLFYPISAAKRVRAALLFSSCAWQLASKKGNRKALKNMR